MSPLPMQPARLILIGLAALIGYVAQPGWFNWVAYLERQVFPTPVRTFENPPITGALKELVLPLVQMLGFTFGIATAGALTANILIHRYQIHRRHKPDSQA